MYRSSRRELQRSRAEDRNRDIVLTDAEWAMLDKTDVYIPDIGITVYPLANNNQPITYYFYDDNAEKQSHAGDVILRTYCNDLGFRRPRYFTCSSWLERGIYVTPYDPKQTFRDIRALSIMRKRVVFLLWGRKAHQLQPAVEQNNHLVMLQPYPFKKNHNGSMSWHTQCTPFTSASEFLGRSKEMWRIDT